MRVSVVSVSSGRAFVVPALVAALSLAGCGGRATPASGERHGPCYPNGTCNDGLACIDGLCVEVSGPDAGSTSDAAPPDLAASPDLATATDLASADLRTPDDTAMPMDLAMPDLAMPDLAMPDLSMPDLSMPDLLPPPDLAMPRPLSFVAARRFGVGSDPRAIVTADFNGDKVPDLATANYNDGTVTVLIGAGAGVFKAPIAFAAGMQPVALAAADLDGDGRVDLAVAVADNGGSVAALFGKGDGSFAAPAYFPIGKNVGLPVSVSTGDFNGDGRIDLVTANYTGGGNPTVSIVTNGGNRAFQLFTNVTAPDTGPPIVAVADFNNDRKPDVAVCTGRVGFNGGRTEIYLGKGDGTLLIPSSIGSECQAMAVGDFNGDGKTDVMTAQLTYYVFVNLGNGDGTLTQTMVKGSLGAWFPSGPSSLSAGDFNGDGVLDGALVNSAIGSALMFLDPTSPNATAPNTGFGLGGGGAASVAGDFDGDGKLDLAVANESDDTVALLLGKGDGTLRAESTFATGVGPNDVGASDLNGDGRPDFVFTDSDANPYVHGSGLNVFASAKSGYTRPYSDVGPYYGVAAADFNGDGSNDFISYSYPNGTTDPTLFVNTGNANLSFNRTTPFGDSRKALQLVAMDMNGDARPDLVGCFTDGNTTYSNVMMNPGMQAPWPTGGAGNCSAIAVADLDHDNRNDLIVTNAGAVTVFVGNGTTQFQMGQRTAIAGAGRVALADLNGDGKLDAVALAGKSVAVLLGNGDATFQPPALTTVSALAASTLTGIAAADFNGDGRADVAVSDTGTSTLSVLLGAGDGTLAAPRPFATALGTAVLLVVDANGDGKPDLATTEAAAGGLLINDSP